MKTVVNAISEGFKLLNSWVEGADRRKFNACKEAAEKYIQTNEDSTLEEPRRKKLLRHYKKRFFHYN